MEYEKKAKWIVLLSLVLLLFLTGCTALGVVNKTSSEIPLTGMQLSYAGNGQFTIIGEAFDLDFADGIGTGHTYKQYYLYWTADGLKEYGGLKITQDELFKINGAKEIIDLITKSGHTIDDIYYRANGIININYHTGDLQNGSFNNITLVYENNILTSRPVWLEGDNSKTDRIIESNLNEYSYGGLYKAAYFSDIATYPDKFPY